METKVLGLIESARFGYGGRDDAMFGLSLTFKMPANGGGVGDFIGTWAERVEHAKYSEAEHMAAMLGAVLKLRDTLKDAGKLNVAELKGTPVELTFDGSGFVGSRLLSWRVLTEVIG